MRFFNTIFVSLFIFIHFTAQATQTNETPFARSEGHYQFPEKQKQLATLFSPSTTLSLSENSNEQEILSQQTNDALSQTNASIDSLQSIYHHDVWFHNSSITLTHDEDNDGYYSRIKVKFDLDTNYSSIEVYAAMILIDNQNHETEYFVSKDFWVYGKSAIDDYQIKSLLEENWPSENYRLRIEIYDAADSSLLTSLDDIDDSNLDNLPLESIDNDANYSSHYTFHEVSVNLIKDGDNDGYYQTFSLNIDADNTSSSRQIHAKILIKNASSSWRNLYTSPTFTLAGTTSQDLQKWDFDMLSGYRADSYQLKVELYETHSDKLLLATNTSDFPQLSKLKFEDASNDVKTNRPQPPSSGGKKSTSSGRGSMNIFTLAALFGLLLSRRRIIKQP